jgi:hypothetical protein
MYYYTRKVLRWLSEMAGQQCSGKYLQGHAYVWCKKTAFHDGVCVDYSGKEFTQPME